MSKRLVVFGVFLIACAGTAAAADWKIRAMWCASEQAVTQGGNIVTNLQSHANAHQRYCKSCASSMDQFDSVLACYEGNDEKWGEVRAQIQKAGRAKLNEFMEAKAPSCCRD